MTPRRIAIAGLWITLVATGSYVFVYLYRWEWMRALTSAAFFLAAEAALLGIAILSRLSKIDDQFSRLNRNLGRMPDNAPYQRDVDSALEETRQQVSSPQRRWFSWLTDTRDQSSVFIPILLGAGVVVSAVAWAMERVAKMAGAPVLEDRLARRLAVLSPPEGLVSNEQAPEPTIRWPLGGY